MSVKVSVRRREWRREYYQKNRERILAGDAKYKANHKEEAQIYHREYKRKLKLEVLTYYSGGVPKCACCGEAHIEFLCIDHIDGGGNQHRRQLGIGGKMYHWLKKNSYPNGFRVLCVSCNMSLGHYGYCPHGSFR